MRTSRSSRFLAGQQLIWESRFGGEAMAVYRTAVAGRALGAVGGVAALVALLVCQELGWVPGEIAAAVLMLSAIAVMCYESWRLVHFMHLVAARYGLPRKAARTFPFKKLRLPEGPRIFDEWVAGQRRRYRADDR